MNTAQQQNTPPEAQTVARQTVYPRPIKRRLEIIAAVLLSITTVATAWSAYQSSRWGGYMSILFNEAGAARTQESQQLALANNQTAIDVGVFLQYAEAVADENEALVDFLHARFRPEMKAAVDAWLATEPLQNPEAPPTPFDLPEYSLAARAEAARLNALAEQKSTEARAANQQGDDYTLLTIAFASTLFFAGISTKFQSFRIVIVLLALGWLMFLVGIATMLGYAVY